MRLTTASPSKESVGEWIWFAFTRSVKSSDESREEQLPWDESLPVLFRV